MRRCSGQLRNSTNHKEGIERNEIQSWTDSRESTEMKRDQKILRVDSRDKDLIRIWYIPSFFGNFWYIIRNFERNDVSTEGKEFDPSGCLFNTRERGREGDKEERDSITESKRERSRKERTEAEKRGKWNSRYFCSKKSQIKVEEKCYWKCVLEKSEFRAFFLFCTVLSGDILLFFLPSFSSISSLLLLNFCSGIIFQDVQKIKFYSCSQKLVVLKPKGTWRKLWGMDSIRILNDVISNQIQILSMLFYPSRFSIHSPLPSYVTSQEVNGQWTGTSFNKSSIH